MSTIYCLMIINFTPKTVFLIYIIKSSESDTKIIFIVLYSKASFTLRFNRFISVFYAIISEEGLFKCINYLP